MTVKKRKKIFILVLGMVMSLCFITIVGCGQSGKKALSVNGYENEIVFELLSDSKLPVALLDGKPVTGGVFDKVMYKITSPEYAEKGETKKDVYQSSFPNVFCDRVGEWTIEYLYGNQSIVKTFKVVDTTAPSLRFSSTPYDVWTSQTDKYSLPTVIYEDYSKIDYDSAVKTLTLNGQSAQVDLMDRYLADKSGYMEYRFEIADVYGNKNSITTGWNVKDATWTDSSLDNGYLADFNEKEYLNIVSSGDLNSYWANTQISESYLDEFEGVNGVLKVNAPVNSSGVAAIKFRLMDSITAKELIANNQNIIIQIYTNTDKVRVGCSVMQPAPIESKHSFAIDVQPGKWNKIVLNNAELNYGFDALGAAIDELSFAFGMMNDSLSSDVEFYVGGIAIASELSAPTDLNLSGNALSWTAVQNADAYEVYENGTATIVTETSYMAKSADSVLGVKAIANEDNLAYLSSGLIVPYIDKTGFKEYEIAIMNTSAYAYLFGASDTTTARVAKSVTAEYLPEYNGEKNVIKVTSVNNATGIGDIVMNLNQVCDSGVTVKYMIEKSSAVYNRFLQPHSEYGVEGLTDLAADGEWKVSYLNYGENYWSTGAKDRIDVMFQGGTENETNVMYFSVVANGNAVKDVTLGERLDAEVESLTDGYLADFDSEIYKELVTIDERWGTVNKEFEILSSFAGEENVLKIDLNLTVSNFGMAIKLPKAMTNGEYTLRYYLKDTLNGGTFMAKNGSVIGTDLVELKTPVDKWATVAVSGCTNNKSLYFLGYVPNSGAGEFTLYLSLVADGNKVAEINQLAVSKALSEEATTLADGYLADFDSNVYQNFVNSYNSYGDIVENEYLESFAGEKNVLKVTVSANGANAGIALNLPKAMTSGTMTLRYYLVNFGGGAVRIRTNPATNDLAELETSIDKWTTVTASGNTDNGTIYIYGYVPSGSMTIYLSAIADGNVVDKVNQDALTNNLALERETLANGYLADFDNAIYQNLVSIYEGPTGPYGTVSENTYLESYKGESNVLKVSVTPCSFNNSGIVITLPKEITENSYTVRYYIESTTNALAIRNSANATLVDSPVAGSWQTIAVSGAIDTNSIYFYAWGANALTVYFSAVADGSVVDKVIEDASSSAVQEELAEGYLADFDSDYYESLVTFDNTWVIYSNASAKYTSSFGEEKNVLKVELDHTGGTFGIVMNLPKAMTSGTFTLRYYLTDCLGAGTFVMRNESYLGADLLEIKTPVNAWNTVVVSGSSDLDTIYFLGYIPSAGKFTVYFSAVADGNVVDKVNSDALQGKLEQEAATLESGYLADFDNEIYVGLANKNNHPNRGANSVNAELIAGGFEGETNVLKITSTNNGVFGANGIGDIVLKLPKACTTGMTVKIWVGNVGSTQYIRFLTPGTESRINDEDINNTTGWQTYYLNYTGSSIKDEIVIMLQGGVADAENVLYFAFVKDGNAL